MTSADLVARQKAVDAAVAEVAVAEQALAQATVVSPIAGTVTVVGVEVGDSVSAGSSTDTIRVEGPGGYQVTTSVAVTELPHVQVGERATVVPDGSTDELEATVVAIGLVPASSGTATTYSVVLALTDPDVDLPSGSLARTGIVTGNATGVVAVPTSAVSTVETGRTVLVMEGGTPTAVPVEVGTVGGRWTEVTDGLEVGETVVLADLSDPLPGSATATSDSSDATGPTGQFVRPQGATGGPPGGATRGGG